MESHLSYHERVMDPSTALRKTIAGYVIGVGVAYLLISLNFIYEEVQFGSGASVDWKFLPRPAVIGTLFASAAFATYLPTSVHRFILTLGVVALPSYLFWIFAANTDITPRRYKGTEHPAMYTSEFVVWFSPPVVISILLAIHRIDRVWVERSSRGDSDRDT